MDADSLPPSIIFLTSLLLFSYVSLADRVARNGNGGQANGKALRWGWAALAALRYGALLAAAGAAFILSLQPEFSWPRLTGVAVAIGLIAVLVEQAVPRLYLRRPAWSSRVALPLLRLLRLAPERRIASANPNASANGFSASANGHLPEDAYLDLDEPAITEDELAGLDKQDREMVRSILELETGTAHELMLPRLDIVAVEQATPLEEVARLIVETGHSRVPVYQDNLDHVVGVAHSLDVMGALLRPPPRPVLKELLRPAFFVPETRHLDDLLEDFKEKGDELAIVVDEYGGTEGIITLKDLLGEIVGEFEDDVNRASEAEIVHLPDGSVLVDAGFIVEDVNELLSVHIEAPEVDTIGGLVYYELGRIPVQGDVVETPQARIEVVSMLGRRLLRLRIARSASAQVGIGGGAAQ